MSDGVDYCTVHKRHFWPEQGCSSCKEEKALALRALAECERTQETAREGDRAAHRKVTDTLTYCPECKGSGSSRRPGSSLPCIRCDGTGDVRIAVDETGRRFGISPRREVIQAFESGMAIESLGASWIGQTDEEEEKRRSEIRTEIERKLEERKRTETSAESESTRRAEESERRAKEWARTSRNEKIKETLTIVVVVVPQVALIVALIAGVVWLMR